MAIVADSEVDALYNQVYGELLTLIMAGTLAEYGPTKQIFTNLQDKRTEDYITGRFG